MNKAVFENPLARELAGRIASGTAAVGVIGLGYVGLPLALAFARAGLPTTGFDIDEAKISSLQSGVSYLSHIADEIIAETAATGRLAGTADFARLGDMSVIIICVPTPLDGERNPNLEFVIGTAESIAANLRPGQLIVLESTTYPGTTAEVVKPILEKGGLRSGADFFLAYSPEREDPGNAEYGTANIPKVVGADGADALALACALYERVVVRTVPVASMEIAEAVKLTENIFRSVNIALVNELKQIYGKMNIDIWDVIEAAKTKPFGYMPFYPGPGLGGHCIPIDPFYLTWRARQVGEETRFIELAGEINRAMPGRVVAALERALEERFGKTLAESHILIVGLAYKKNVNDTRESPAFALIEIIEASGGRTEYYDPLVPSIPETRDHQSLKGRNSIDWNLNRFADFDAIVICTDHDGLDLQGLIDHGRLIIDTRNAASRLKDQGDNVLKA